MAKRSPWAEFVGHKVEIAWKDPDFDWPYFTVESCAGPSAILLGESYPDGSIKHDGSASRASWREVRSIKYLSPPADSTFFDMENGVLEKARKLVDGRDKAEHYGPPEEFMGRLARMWGGYLGMELKPGDAALMMALLKAARLRTNPEHEDSLIDFAGYARIFERVK